MTEAVVVTGWNRPDFLRAALTCLARADDGQQHYIVSLDRRHTRDVRQVADWFSRDMGRTTILTPNHPYKGNSYNTLHALMRGLESNASLVYLVEDDVLVGNDFFTFHRSAHRLLPRNLAVSACRNQYFEIKDDPEPDEEHAYAHMSYQSLGVSFRRSSLAQLAPHLQKAYFSDPIAYCRRMFPGSAVNPANAEQDGLIHRIGEAAGLPTVYPLAPRAYHAGFTGYHRRGMPLTGGTASRAAQIMSMDTDQLNARARTYRDHVAVDLEAPRAALREVSSGAVSA